MTIYNHSVWPPFKGTDGRYHYLYYTIDLLTGSYYKGKHSTESLYRKYCGSGNEIREIERLHGKTNLITAIVRFFDTEDDTYIAEESFITFEDLCNPNCYNDAPGGRGKIFTSKKFIEETRPGRCKPHSQDRKDKISNSLMGHYVTIETKGKISKAHKGKKRGPQSEEQKKNTSEALKKSPKAIAYRESRKGFKHKQESKDKLSASLKTSEKYKEAMDKLRGKPKGPMKEEHRKNNRTHMDNLNSKRYNCTNCGKEVSSANLSRWHNDNCREPKDFYVLQ